MPAPLFHFKTMTKKYTSYSTISISVLLPNGGRAHVSFTPVTGGSSMYITKDKNMQDALESHVSFGKLFKLAKVIDENKEAEKAAPKAKAEPKKEEKKAIDVVVTCSEDAKEYLADKFGLSRSKLRNREQIMAAGEANGVNFIFK